MSRRWSRRIYILFTFLLLCHLVVNQLGLTLWSMRDSSPGDREIFITALDWCYFKLIYGGLLAAILMVYFRKNLSALRVFICSLSALMIAIFLEVFLRWNLTTAHHGHGPVQFPVARYLEWPSFRLSEATYRAIWRAPAAGEQIESLLEPDASVVDLKRIEDGRATVALVTRGEASFAVRMKETGEIDKTYWALNVPIADSRGFEAIFPLRDDFLLTHFARLGQVSANSYSPLVLPPAMKTAVGESLLTFHPSSGPEGSIWLAVEPKFGQEILPNDPFAIYADSQLDPRSVIRQSEIAKMVPELRIDSIEGRTIGVSPSGFLAYDIHAGVTSDEEWILILDTKGKLRRKFHFSEGSNLFRPKYLFWGDDTLVKIASDVGRITLFNIDTGTSRSAAIDIEKDLSDYQIRALPIDKTTFIYAAAPNFKLHAIGRDLQEKRAFLNQMTSGPCGARLNDSVPLLELRDGFLLWLPGQSEKERIFGFPRITALRDRSGEIYFPLLKSDFNGNLVAEYNKLAIKNLCGGPTKR